jgi:hypothetical protein
VAAGGFLDRMMTTTIGHRAYRGVAVAVLAASLTGCAADQAADRSSPTSTAPAATPSSDPTAGAAVPTDPASTVRIRLIIGDDVATATLEDTAAARDFAAMLPTTIDLHDLLGREKAGRLPRQLDIDRARREFDYQVGELAYWPPSNEIAIFYADDGQAIPQPGLVRLGTIDTGLEVMAAAGNDFEMTIEPLD